MGADSACLPRPVHTTDAPAAIGPYSQAVVCDGWVFTSGQIGIDPATGEVVEGGVVAQTHRVLGNLGAVLHAAGARREHVVKTTVFLTSMDDFATFNPIYEAWFGDARPARSTVQVSRLPRGVCIEIEAVARISG
jgi:2-iminobutanoate/2-iminopropanoate deaminase